MRLEPGRDGLDVVVRGAEARAEFLRRDPFVVIGGLGIELLALQSSESRVLLGAALEAQHHVVHGKAVRRETAIKFRAREWMRGAGTRDDLCVVHGRND